MKEDSDKPPSPANFFSKVKNFFTRSNSPKSKKELVSVVRQSAEKELIAPDVLNMVEGVLQVSDKQVRDIMVSRSKMTGVPHTATLAELLDIVIEPGYSRYPVLGDNRNEILGILIAKDLLKFCLKDNKKEFNLMEHIRPVFFVPESKRLNALLKEFRSAHTHMSIVIDEYGGIAGLVTIEDVLEEIVGEIEDEHDIDEEESIVKQLTANQFMVNALMTIDNFNEKFEANLSDENFDTIGGLVMQKFGRMPKRGETMEVGNLQFKVVQANNRRVQYMLVTR